MPLSKAYWRRNIEEESSKHSAYWIFYIFSTYYKKVKQQYWSKQVGLTSNALDLEKGVFTLTSPKIIAQSLKRSAENSNRKKSGSYKSAMSMLNFYINRSGNKLPAKQKSILEQAKVELRKEFSKVNKN